MLNEDLIVASSIREDAILVSVPRTERCHVMELRIQISPDGQAFLTDLFKRCYYYRVLCTRVANQLLRKFRDGDEYKKLMQASTKARTLKARQAITTQYSALRKQCLLHEEKVFCKQIHDEVDQQKQSEATPPSHIAQRIEAAVWRDAIRVLKQRRGTLRYPSYSEFRVIEGKNNRANITFDPRPEEMKLRINGRLFSVKPLRNSDFSSHQLSLANAYANGSKGPGQILYCRIIRRLVNHKGTIEWGYWLQLVVNGAPPIRRNTPKETPTETPSVVGLCQEPRFLATYTEGSCRFITMVPEEHGTYAMAQSEHKDDLRAQYTKQKFLAYRKGRYHQIAKQLLSGATALYATPMLENRITGISDVAHQAFWQALKDEARHTGTQLFVVPINRYILDDYIPQPPITTQTETIKGQHPGMKKQKDKPYPFFMPFKNAFVLTCLRKVTDPKHPDSRYHLMIDEPTATQRLARFRRSMARTLHGETVNAYEQVLETPELKQWTGAKKPSEKPANEDQTKKVGQSEGSSQKVLPTGKSNQPKKPQPPKPLKEPSHRLVERHLLETGPIRPDFSVAYMQLSSWLLELPVNIILGAYNYKLTTLRFFYLLTALAQKQIFQEKRPHKKGDPYTLDITPHFLSYCNKGNFNSESMLQSIREELMPQRDPAKAPTPPMLLFKNKRREKIYFLDNIEAIETVPDYYLDVRKIYRVTINGAFMSHLYANERVKLPLHVLMDCGKPGEARLISYLIYRLRTYQNQPEKIQMTVDKFAEFMQLEKWMTYAYYRNTLYSDAILPLLRTVEHYFYLGDINFVLWCEPPASKPTAKQPIETQLTFTLQLPPETTLGKEEYEQLQTDSPFYRTMLQQLLQALPTVPYDLPTRLRTKGFWEIADKNPRFFKRIWSTVSRMCWFQGSSREKDHNSEITSHHDAIATQIYSEKVLLSYYAPESK